MWVRPLGQEDPLEKEMATYSSILAWRIPWTEKPKYLTYTCYETSTGPLCYRNSYLEDWPGPNSATEEGQKNTGM